MQGAARGWMQGAARGWFSLQLVPGFLLHPTKRNGLVVAGCATLGIQDLFVFLNTAIKL